MGQRVDNGSLQEVQLLALNAFFELARNGRDPLNAVPTLETVKDLGLRLDKAPASVAAPELEAAQAAVLYQALFS